jgi:glutathione S-transferase
VPDIVVHHLEDSRSQRVLWLLEELGLPYVVVRHTRDPATLRAPPGLRKIHPLGKAPIVLIDGEILAESGAVITTFVDRFGPHLRPDGGDELRLYRFFLHYAEGSLAPPLLVRLIANGIERAPVPFFVKPITRRIARGVHERYTWPELDLHFDFLEDHLSRHPWFTGAAFTAADVQMSFEIEGAASRRAMRGERPSILAWLDRIHGRPAYQRALERGGPYAYARTPAS